MRLNLRKKERKVEKERQKKKGRSKERRSQSIRVASKRCEKKKNETTSIEEPRVSLVSGPEHRDKLVE
jgi:hypothetical protein